LNTRIQVVEKGNSAAGNEKTIPYEKGKVNISLFFQAERIRAGVPVLLPAPELHLFTFSSSILSEYITYPFTGPHVQSGFFGL